MTNPVPQRFAGRLAVVTGAASGIGAAVCHRLTDEGARVLGVDVAEPETTAATEFLHADVAETATWQRVAATTERLGGADVLVSNAAIVDLAPVHETGDESWDRQLTVNLSAAFRGVRALLPQLRSDVTQSRIRKGSVVLVSSVHAHFGLYNRPAYAAAKGGLCSLARQLAAEYGLHMRVNTVVPGPISTPAWDEVSDADQYRSVGQTALFRMGSPEEVASCIAFLASEEASYVTGTELVVDGGWSITKDSS